MTGAHCGLLVMQINFCIQGVTDLKYMAKQHNMRYEFNFVIVSWSAVLDVAGAPCGLCIWPSVGMLKAKSSLRCI